MCYPCLQYTEIFLALKIEEKNISDCQILETKSSNIVYLILPCIRHYIKVGFNGTDICESKCAAQLQVNLKLRPIQGGIRSKLTKRKITFLPSSLKIFPLLPASLNQVCSLLVILNSLQLFSSFPKLPENNMAVGSAVA